MGGSLQPYYAQRNMDGMTTQQLAKPAPDSAADHELAVAIARLENTQAQQAANLAAHRQQHAYAYQTAAPHQPAGQPASALPGYMLGGGSPAAAAPQPELWRTGSGAHYDQALTRQMSGQVAVPLTPRINSASAPQEPPEAARRRLEVRLKQYSLVEKKTKGDGNCQFRSISDQLYRDPKFHEDVRRVCVHHLRSNPGQYAHFVPSDYWRYCWEMEQDGTWGDHVTLQAIADAFGLRINVLTSYPDNSFVSIRPQQQRTHRVLYVSFWAEVHYQSVYPAKEPPRSEKLLGSKKLGRLFGA